MVYSSRRCDIYFFPANLPLPWLASSCSIPSTSAPLHTPFRAQLYLDTVVFYGFLFTLVAVATTATYVPAFSRAMHYRLRVVLPRKWNPFPTGVAIGEVVLIAMVGGLYAFWVWHWRVYHTRIENEAGSHTG